MHNCAGQTLHTWRLWNDLVVGIPESAAKAGAPAHAKLGLQQCREYTMCQKDVISCTYVQCMSVQTRPALTFNTKLSVQINPSITL